MNTGSSWVLNCIGSLAFLLLTLRPPTAGAQAPSFSWSVQVGGALDQSGSSIAVDSAGNLYASGIFAGTATIGGVVLSSQGQRDAFLAKYDATGRLLWARSVGGSQDDFIYGLGVDGAGNCYISGLFTGAANFGNYALTNKFDPFGQNAFLAKYDGGGNAVWVRQISGSRNNAAIGLAVDPAGNSYLTGDFAGTANFGSTALSTRTGDNDIFVAKYDTNGDLIWVRQAGSPFNDTGIRITLDRDGNCFVAGIFTETAQFGAISLTSTNLSDTFLAKYDAAGLVLWVKQIQRSTTHFAALDVAADSAGNSYLTGGFAGIAIFGADLLASAGNDDFFVAKYDSAGNLVWLQRGGGPGDDEAIRVSVDSSGNAYLLGTFSGTASIGSDALTSLGDTDLFVAKYDPSGKVLWAARAGGTSNESAQGLALNLSGNCYLSGAFSNMVSFGSVELTSTGLTDGYFAKLGGSALTPLLRLVPGSIAFAPGNGFRFQLIGSTGTAAIIQASTNLLRWTSISTNVVPTGGVLNVDDPHAIFQTQSFYRAVRGP